MKKIIAAVVLMAISSIAFASGSAISSWASLDGETMDEFVVRNSRAIEASGLRQNAEVCGSIVEEDGKYRLELITKGSNIQCTISHDEKSTLIHTHLPYKGTRFSPADYTHRGYMIRNGVICYNDGSRGTEVTVTKYGRRSGSTCASQ